MIDWKSFVSLVVAAGVKQELQKFGVSTVAELDGVERQIDVDAPDVPGIRGRKKEVGHPAADDHHRVTEGGEDLSDIDEHTAGGNCARHAIVITRSTTARFPEPS